MQRIRSSLIGVAAAAVLLLASPRADAITFGFENPDALDPTGSYDSCFGGENCGSQLSFENDGVSLTVSAFGRANAVIQDLNPSHGGLGAVRQFDHGHFHYRDRKGDEVDRGQGLLLTFEMPVSLTQVLFNTDDHGHDFDDCDTFRFSIDGLSWETLGLDHSVWFDLPESQTFYFKYGGHHPDDFYIAGVRVDGAFEPQADPVPEPGTLALLGAGLLGLARRTRQRRAGRMDPS